MKYTPEERLDIGRQIYDGELSRYEAAEQYGMHLRFSLWRYGDVNTFLCGREEICKNCRSMIEKPSIYPVYYSEDAYDATKFALACLLWGESEKVPPQFLELSYKAVIWEAERISLIKKKCHEYDDEWRMIRPTMTPDRTCIKMKPNKVVLGLRMPEYERSRLSQESCIFEGNQRFAIQ